MMALAAVALANDHTLRRKLRHSVDEVMAREARLEKN